ncbi:MAG TPA: urease accessory protein UreD [Acidimicrobiales bacterium]|jgi:urease accessory protein|nr:urease accessory protein UreD [Acidimicrobiales bacterium]
MTTLSSAAASIRFRAGIGGEPIVHEMKASAAHTFQPSRWGATLVGSAAHPIAGDHLAVNVGVGVGCCAEIDSAGATVARRGSRRPVWSGPAGSTYNVSANVASDAMLTWRPEPGVAADACSHRSEAVIELAGNARLLWRDEFVLERRAEATPGTWNSRVRIVRDGWPVLCTELAIGPGSPLWESPAVLEGARAISLLAVIDPEHPAERWAPARTTEGSATGVALPLAGPGVQIVAWGDDLADCRSAVEQLVPLAGTPDWAAGRWQRTRALDVVS